jgi:hypothetical protein
MFVGQLAQSGDFARATAAGMANIAAITTFNAARINAPP